LDGPPFTSPGTYHQVSSNLKLRRGIETLGFSEEEMNKLNLEDLHQPDPRSSFGGDSSSSGYPQFQGLHSSSMPTSSAKFQTTQKYRNKTGLSEDILLGNNNSGARESGRVTSLENIDYYAIHR
jgi:hypothetical protein